MARGGAGAARLSGRFDTVVFSGCIILALVASALPNQMRDPVASGLRRTIVAPLVGLQQNSQRWRSAWLDAERKVLQRDTIAMQLAQAQSLTVENERLRKLLGLGSRLSWGFVPAEALHTSGRAEDVVTTITLTAGSKAGVAQYSPVVAPEGVVGLVQTVDPGMSIAILYSHPDFRVSAMSADSAPAFGIVYPHLNVRRGFETERYLLELRNVPFRSALKPGTPIFSSGLGGGWPRGVLIGNVVEEVKDSASFSRTYILKPAVNPAHLTSVMVLTPQRRSQGVGNIWASATQVQAATRQIVAGGDSVAREAAIAEAAARRAAMDSVRRAGGISTDSLRRAGVGDSLRLTPLPPDTQARPRRPRPAVAVPRPDTPRDTTRPDTLRTP